MYSWHTFTTKNDQKTKLSVGKNKQTNKQLICTPATSKSTRKKNNIQLSSYKMKNEGQKRQGAERTNYSIKP